MIKPCIVDRKIIWHPKQHYTYIQYRQASDDVFNSLRFDDAKMRFILIGSYRMNLRHLVVYAVDSGIDELEFIQSLRSFLREMPGCFDMER